MIKKWVAYPANSTLPWVSAWLAPDATLGAATAAARWPQGRRQGQPLLASHGQPWPAMDSHGQPIGQPIDPLIGPPWLAMDDLTSIALPGCIRALEDITRRRKNKFWLVKVRQSLSRSDKD